MAVPDASKRFLSTAAIRSGPGSAMHVCFDKPPEPQRLVTGDSSREISSKTAANLNGRDNVANRELVQNRDARFETRFCTDDPLQRNLCSLCAK